MLLCFSVDFRTDGLILMDECSTTLTAPLLPHTPRPETYSSRGSALNLNHAQFIHPTLDSDRENFFQSRREWLERDCLWQSRPIKADVETLCPHLQGPRLTQGAAPSDYKAEGLRLHFEKHAVRVARSPGVLDLIAGPTENR